MQLLSVFVYFNSIKVQLELRVPFFSLLPLPHFNSIKVQLELSSSTSHTCNRIFQFHKGTIRTSFILLGPSLVMYFNSIKVQLEPVSVTLNWEPTSNFNSIKVQLELRPSELSRSSQISFQFHKGTIRTTEPRDGTGCQNQFQFHKGTIRTSRFFRACSLFSYFNSIKVQLEQAMPKYQK